MSAATNSQFAILDSPSASASATARADPEPAPTNVPPVPVRASGLKLRDCCQSCARSKVKCTKEKPSCARCDAKGIACRYLQSKRPGRIPGSGVARRLNPANHTHTHSVENPRRRVGGDASVASPSPRRRSGVPSTQSGDTVDDLLAPLITPLSPVSNTLAVSASDNATCTAISLFDSYYTAPDAIGSLTSPSLDVDGDHDVHFVWDDCLNVLATMDDTMYTSLMDWDPTVSGLTGNLPINAERGNDTPPCGSSTQSLINHGLPLAPHTSLTTTLSSATSPRTSTSDSASSHSLASSSSSIPVILDLSKRITASTTHGSDHSLPASLELGTADKYDQPSHVASTSCCLDKALDLLKTVTKDPGLGATATHGHPLTQAILANNKEVIQATLTILACSSCTSDRLLLMLLLLITTKILPRYASAAALDSNRSMGGFRRDSASSGTVAGGIDGEAYPRQAKQQVLRELHLVQRLITQLSLRLKGLSSHGRDGGSGQGLLEPQSLLRQHSGSTGSQNMSMSTSSLVATRDAGLMPISTRTLDFVEDDVRNSLSVLSATVRNALKDS